MAVIPEARFLINYKIAFISPTLSVVKLEEQIFRLIWQFLMHSLTLPCNVTRAVGLVTGAGAVTQRCNVTRAVGLVTGACAVTQPCNVARDVGLVTGVAVATQPCNVTRAVGLGTRAAVVTQPVMLHDQLV